MEITLHASLEEIPPAEWNALAEPDFPFLDHEHLVALERNGCVGEEAGWIPLHLVAREGGRPVAAMPTYVKDNSYGEFIFDWGWAQAYQRYGVEYYPKLVSAAPFTPATGERILVDPIAPPGEARALREALAKQAFALAKATRCSSAHVLFLPKDRAEQMGREGFLVRHSHQYHWRNEGYADFGAFLAALTSKRRRQIALERRQLAAVGDVVLETIEGEALTPEHARVMCDFYLDTNQKHFSHACLNLGFFEEIFRTMRGSVVLFLARRAGKPIAAAINFRKGRHLYGRYWGCSEEVRNLHFELCYYRSIEYCVDRGLSLYEAGAQGEHKVPRGFRPTLTYSAHELFHPAFRDAIGKSLEEEKRAIARLFAEYAQHSPFLADERPADG